MSDQQPASAPPTINDVRHGWGLSIEELNQLLLTEPETWEYCEPGKLWETDYAVVYRHALHGYYQCWIFDKERVMQWVQLIIPYTDRWLVDAFLVGSHVSGEYYFYKQETIDNPTASPRLSIEEVEDGIILSVMYKEVFGDDYRQACNLDLILPTISTARYGWRLSISELNVLLLANPEWKQCEPATTEDGEYVVMYRNRVHGFSQCWDFNAEGKMHSVRLLVLPDDKWLVGAFLTGAYELGDSWVYPEERISYPGAEGLQMYIQEHVRMTVLTVRFVALGDTTTL